MKRFLAVLAFAILCGSLFAAPNNSASFSLDGNIGVNFYLDLDSYSGATKVVITSPDSAKNDTTSTVQTVIAKADWPDEYRFGIAVAPVQLTRAIKVEIFNGDTLLATAFDNTAKSIADQYLADSDANLQNLAKALLTYCAAAQTEFDYNTSNLANAGVSFTLADPDWNEVPTLTYGRVNEDPSITLEKIGFNSLASTQVNFKFSMASGTTLADYTVAKTFGGEGITIAKQEELDGTYMVVSVSNITSLDLNETFTFDIKKSGVTVYTVNGSALSYMKYVSATKADFAKAAYNYGKYAEAYFGNDTNTAYVYTFSQFEEAMASNVERVVLRSDITWDDTVAAKIQLDFTGRTLDLGGYTLSNVPAGGYFDLRGDSFTVKNGTVVGRNSKYATLNFNYNTDTLTNKSDVSAGGDFSEAITVSNIVLKDAGINQGICYVHYSHLVCESSPEEAVCINGGSAVFENCRIKTDNGYALDILGKGTVTIKGTQTGYNTYSSKAAYAFSLKNSCNLEIDGDVSVSVESNESTSGVIYIANTSSDDKTVPGVSLILNDNSHLTMLSNLPKSTIGALYLRYAYDAGRIIVLGENAVLELASRSESTQQLFYCTSEESLVDIILSDGSKIVVEGKNLISDSDILGEIRLSGAKSQLSYRTDTETAKTAKTITDLRTHVHTGGTTECPTCGAICVNDFTEFVAALTAAKTSTNKKIVFLGDITWDAACVGETESFSTYVGFDGTSYTKSNTRIKQDSGALTVDMTGLILDLNGFSLKDVQPNSFNILGCGFTIENGAIESTKTQTMFINYTGDTVSTTGARLYKAVEAAQTAESDDYIVLRNLTVGTLQVCYSPIIFDNVTAKGRASGTGAIDLNGCTAKFINGSNLSTYSLTNSLPLRMDSFSTVSLESGTMTISTYKSKSGTAGYGVSAANGSSFTVKNGTTLAITADTKGFNLDTKAAVVIENGSSVSVTIGAGEAYTGVLNADATDYVSLAGDATITDNRTF